MGQNTERFGGSPLLPGRRRGPVSGAPVTPPVRPFDFDDELAKVRGFVLDGLRHSERSLVESLLSRARAGRAVGPRDWRTFLTAALRAEARLYAEALGEPGLQTWRPPTAESGREAEVFALQGVAMILMTPHLDMDQIGVGLQEARAQLADHDAEGTDADDSERLVAAAAEIFYTAALEARTPSSAATVH